MSAAPVRHVPHNVAFLATALAIGVGISVIAVIPGVRSTGQFHPLVDGWVKAVSYVLVAALVTLRAVLRAEERHAWSWLAAGYALQAFGFVAWLGFVRWQDPVASPSVADVGWLLSAPMFVIGIVLLLRRRWPRRSLAVALDALAAVTVAAALTVAAVSEAVPLSQAIGGTAEVIALTYPVLDIAIITAVIALVASLGRRWRDPSVLWLAASMVGMAVIDVIYAVQTATGTFRPASLLSGANLAATAAGALAAWCRPAHRYRPVRAALPGLGIPASFGFVALSLLVFATQLHLNLASIALAILAMALLAVRVGLTFRVANEVGRLRRAEQVAHLGSWVAEPDQLEHEWARATIALLGLSAHRHAKAGHTTGLHEVVMADDLAAVLAAMHAGRHSGVVNVTYRVERPGGDLATVRARAEADVDESGRIERWVGTLQDITEQSLLAAALADSEDNLRRVLAATNDGWWTVDTLTGDASVSDRWWQLHGYQPDRAPVTDRPWLAVTTPVGAAEMDSAIEHAISDQVPSLTLTLTTLHRDGHELPIQLRMLLDYDEDGSLRRLSAAATDLTAARQAEAAKDALLAAVSHELRTPLTPIVGFSELLTRADTLSAEHQQAAQAIARNAAHLSGLVDELLFATRANRRRETPKPRGVDLAEHLMVILKDRDATDVRLAGALPSVIAWVDPGHLTQIINNLLDNAARHGAPPVEMRVEADGTTCAVTVSDHGPGVPDWFRPKLFEDFSQATAGDQRPTIGLGLGLAIARRLAQANGGTLNYEPTTDMTSFVLRIPAAGSMKSVGPRQTHS